MSKEKGLDGKACWDGYKLAGTKKKNGKTVDNCVPINKEENEQNFELYTRLKNKNKKLEAKGQIQKKIIDEAQSVGERVKKIVAQKRAEEMMKKKPSKVVEINPELKEPDINENISLTVKKVILEKSLKEQQILNEVGPLAIPAVATSPEWGPALWAALAGAGIYGVHSLNKLKGSKVESPAWLKSLLKGKRWQPVSKETANPPTLITPLSQRKKTRTIIPDPEVQKSATKIQQPSASTPVVSTPVAPVVGKQSNIPGRKIDLGAFSGLTKGKISTPEVSVSQQASAAKAAVAAAEGKKEQEKFARQAASMAHGQKITNAETKAAAAAAEGKKEQDRIAKRTASLDYGQKVTGAEAAAKKEQDRIAKRTASLDYGQKVTGAEIKAAEAAAEGKKEKDRIARQAASMDYGRKHIEGIGKDIDLPTSQDKDIATKPKTDSPGVPGVGVTGGTAALGLTGLGLAAASLSAVKSQRQTGSGKKKKRGGYFSGSDKKSEIAAAPTVSGGDTAGKYKHMATPYVKRDGFSGKRKDTKAKTVEKMEKLLKKVKGSKKYEK